MSPYFGEPWDDPATDGQGTTPTPTGIPCTWCTIPIQHGDRGFITACARRNDAGTIYGSLEPVHRECLLLATTGPAAHMDGRCSCRGAHRQHEGQSPAEVRAEAIEAWERATWKPKRRANGT